jgi:uncharacterized RDD family membrane protein YckC
MLNTRYFARRAGAFIIDIICAALPLWLTSPVAISFWQSGASGQLAAEVMIVANAAVSLALFYLVQTWQLAHGRPTPGRCILRVEISGDQGKRPSWKASVGREAASFIFLAAVLAFALYPLLVLPALWTLFDRQARTPFDVLARTRVHLAEAQ